MLQYILDEFKSDDDPMVFIAEDQCWDKATLKQLKDEHNIVFMTNGDGVKPVMIINKDSKNPLIVIGSEDDGVLYFKREYGHFANCFSAYWAKPLIADLEEALRLCDEVKERLKMSTKCDQCNNEKLKYIRSEKGIMDTTIYIYFCDCCKREIKIIK